MILPRNLGGIRPFGKPRASGDDPDRLEEAVRILG